MRHLREALRLFAKLDGEAESERSTAKIDALCATHLDNAVLSRADEHDVLL